MSRRCDWAEGHPLLREYHDTEWGVPSHDDVHLYEHLVLEGAQAGLSWLTILKRREGYRRAFAGFDPRKVARFNRRSVDRLLRDTGIIRNRAKIESAISNAKRVLEIQSEFGSFAAFLWGLVGDAPRRGKPTRSWKELPAKTELSTSVSRELKQRGFRFVGPTGMYAFMQAVGMVDDHVVGCPRRGSAGGGLR